MVLVGLIAPFRPFQIIFLVCIKNFDNQTWGSVGSINSFSEITTSVTIKVCKYTQSWSTAPPGSTAKVRRKQRYNVMGPNLTSLQSCWIAMRYHTACENLAGAFIFHLHKITAHITLFTLKKGQWFPTNKRLGIDWLTVNPESERQCTDSPRFIVLPFVASTCTLHDLPLSACALSSWSTVKGVERKLQSIQSYASHSTKRFSFLNNVLWRFILAQL